MYRYLTVFWAVIIQICLGAVYAWSTFVVPLKSGYGLSSVQTQIIFGLMIAVFASMMIITGRLLKKYGPRLITASGGIVYGMGFIAASFSGGSFAVLLVSMGLIAGVGLGLGYISSIIPSQQCFPRQKGFVTGLVVAGFGGGAVLTSLAVKPLLSNGTDILRIFRFMGIGYFLLIFLGALFLKTPPEKKKPDTEKVSVKELIGQKIFRTMFICMFTGTFAGLMIIGNLSPIGISLGTSQVASILAISTFAIGNAAGRITWGRLYDKLGSVTILASLGFMGISLLGLLLFGYSDILFPVFTCLTGFNFGANLVLYTAHTADVYGINRVGSVYPYVSLAYGLSAILAPAFGGLCYDLKNAFIIPLVTASVLSVAGAALFTLYRIQISKAHLHKE